MSSQRSENFLLRFQLDKPAQIYFLTRKDRFLEMAQNCSVLQPAKLHNLPDGFSFPEKMQRLAHSVRELGTHRGGRLAKRIVRKHLARIALQVRRDRVEKNRPELTLLLLTHPADEGKLAVARGIEPRHLAERDVGENDVGRDAAFVGELFAQLAQSLEQRLVAGDFARAVFGGFRRGHGFGKRNFLARLERNAAFVGELDDVELVGVLKQEAQPHQFAPHGGPFRAVVLLADAIGGKRFVAELAHLLRVRTAQDLHHVLDTHAEAALLPDAIDTRKKLLRRERAIPGLARGEAVVAAAAVVICSVAAGITTGFLGHVSVARA